MTRLLSNGYIRRMIRAQRSSAVLRDGIPAWGQVSPNKLHVALAIPEDETKRLATQGSTT